MGFTIQVHVNKIALSDHTEIKASEIQGKISELYLDITLDQNNLDALLKS